MNGYSNQFALHLKRARMLENGPREPIFATARECMKQF